MNIILRVIIVEVFNELMLEFASRNSGALIYVVYHYSRASAEYQRISSGAQVIEYIPIIDQSKNKYLNVYIIERAKSLNTRISRFF